MHEKFCTWRLVSLLFNDSGGHPIPNRYKKFPKCYADATESRMLRLNVHTYHILAHAFSYGTLDLVVSGAIHTLVCVVFAYFACHSYQHNIMDMFCILFIYFLAVALAAAVSQLCLVSGF